MLRIRLQRRGTRRKAKHKIVIMEHSEPTDGRALETLGTYNPLPDPPEIQIDAERIAFWTQRGAQMSPAVAKLLKAHVTYRQPSTPAAA